MAEKKTEKKIRKANKFHVRVKPGTAEWLWNQVNEDAPSVPAVIREIVEDKKRAEKNTAPAKG